MGILDEDPFPAVVYSNANAKTVLESILGGYFVLELSEELQTEKLTGYIPDCTRREALQQVAFALRAVVDTSGTGNVKVWRLSEETPTEIPMNRLYVGGEVSQSAIVTEVRVTAHTYSTSGSGSDTVEVGGKKYFHTTAVTVKQNPNITASYDIKVFCDVDEKTQRDRIAARNGKASLEAFESRWIPLENKYISHFEIEKKCDITLKIGDIN